MDRMIEVLMPYDLYKKLFYDNSCYIDRLTQIKDSSGKLLKAVISE